MSFDLLPPELILQILRYLPVHDISAFDLVSRYCHDIVCLNENTIYQAAAVFHGFVRRSRNQHSPPLVSEVTSNPDATGLLDGVTSWKEICRRRVLREYAWRGKQHDDHQQERQPHIDIYLPSILMSIHRFKVDEVERTVVCSTTAGGLFVVAIDTKQILWSLPWAYVAQYAHVEYDQGFIVFTRHGDGVEVWRRSSDCFDPERYLQCSPEPSQIQASPLPVPEFPPRFPPRYNDYLAPPDSLRGPRRGAYLPFALLFSPAPARSYRLVYPHLLVVSGSTNQAFIWHIPTSTLAETIEIEPPENQEASYQSPHINYVDFNSSFIFVCWSSALVMYRRETVDDKTNMTVLLNLKSIGCDTDKISPQGIRCDTFVGQVLSDLGPFTTSSKHPVLGPSGAYSVTKFNDQQGLGVGRWFSATHVSPDGRDLVAVTGGGSLMYIPDFQITAPGQRERAPFRICFSPYRIRYIDYLAFDGTRILLAIDSEIMSITVRDLLHPTKTLLAPKIRHLAMLPGPERNSANWKVSCLQVHSGSAWFAYLPYDGRATSGLACVDLSPVAVELKHVPLKAQATFGQQRVTVLRVNHFFLATDLFLASVVVCLLAIVLLARPDWTLAL